MLIDAIILPDGLHDVFAIPCDQSPIGWRIEIDLDNSLPTMSQVVQLDPTIASSEDDFLLSLVADRFRRTKKQRELSCIFPGTLLIWMTICEPGLGHRGRHQLSIQEFKRHDTSTASSACGFYLG